MSEPEPEPESGFTRFLRWSSIGIIGCVAGAAVFASGAVQLFAICAIGCGLTVALAAGLIRWLRGFGLLEILCLGALSGWLAEGLRDLNRTR